jgi:hypothetical protein
VGGFGFGQNSVELPAHLCQLVIQLCDCGHDVIRWCCPVVRFGFTHAGPLTVELLGNLWLGEEEVEVDVWFGE